MAGQFSVFSKRGMVVSSQPLATPAGVGLFMDGGNPIDAGVATAAVLRVGEPSSLGIRGDAFRLFCFRQRKTLKALDASGRSPYATNLDFCRNSGFKGMPQRGIHSVTVPGAVHGWSALLGAYGTMPLGEGLRAAIQYCEEGFPVAELTAEAWHESEDSLKNDEAAGMNELVNGRESEKFLRIHGWRKPSDGLLRKDRMFFTRVTLPKRSSVVRKKKADYSRSRTLPIIAPIGWSRSRRTIEAMTFTNCRLPRTGSSLSRC